MTTQLPNPFTPTEALRYGWRTATAHVKNLLPISAIGAILAPIQSSLSHARGSATLTGRLVQVLLT